MLGLLPYIAGVSSCTRESVPGEGREIVFRIDSDISVTSRASVVTSLASFDILASKDGSVLWYVTATEQDGVIRTGQVWSSSMEGATFYASNATLTDEAVPSLSYDRSMDDTDIICAVLEDVSQGDDLTLTFCHVLARIGSFSVTSTHGYLTVEVVASLPAAVSGTYRLDGTWSSLGTTTQTLAEGTNDIWLIPGDYAVSVSYKLVDETSGTVKSFSASPTVSIPAGKTSDLAFSAAQEVAAVVYRDFEDEGLTAILLSNYDTDGDGQLSEEELAAVTDLGRTFTSNTSITTFDELRWFTSLASISNAAFNGCTALEHVTLPEGITAIGNTAFYNCRVLQEIIIPEGVTSIGKRAFNQCYALASVSFPSTLQSIDEAAFGYCYALTEVTLPASLTTIGAYAFTSDRALTSVTILATTPPALTKSNAFPAGATIYVPAASVDTYKNTSPWSGIASRIEAIP